MFSYYSIIRKTFNEKTRLEIASFLFQFLKVVSTLMIEILGSSIKTCMVENRYLSFQL